jgi:DNA phosphorothioation-associated putative methyltransferase
METAAIPRHKTAIRRGAFSRPVKCLLRDGLLDRTATLFDYGCGHGEDVDLLQADGYRCSGWDPAYRPEGAKQHADVVSLGYVINVIEDLQERADTLRQAWLLAHRLLVASAQVAVDGRGKAPVEFGDGVLTGRGTFQKIYDHGELKGYLEEVLGTEAIPAAPGVFYLFKEEAARQGFLANRFRRLPVPPRKPLCEQLFEKHRTLLEPFMSAVAALGRLPEPAEFPQAVEVMSQFGSLKRAFSLVCKVTGSEEWEAIRRRRSEDLLVYLALSRFGRRLPLGQLPQTLQADMKAFFGSYAKACKQADELLFTAGNAVAIDKACRRSTVGKLLPDDLYVHRSALETLDPLLRIYEGCGRAFLGEVEGANIIKIHRRSGKLSYLVYPDFETDPHPALLRCVKLNLRTRQLESYDYAQSANPPILHRKETFLHPSHPLYEKFSRLTKQEVQKGLLSETVGIGNRSGWEARLREAGMTIKGHHLAKRVRPT